MNNQETFQQKIEKMKREQEQLNIDVQKANERAKDETDSIAAVKTLFVSNVNKLAAGTVVSVEDQRITVQLELSLTSKYPKSMDTETGKVTVACVQVLSVVNNLPTYSNVVDVKVGMAGLVDSGAGGICRLILDSRVKSQEATA